MADKEREDSCVELCDSWCEQAGLPTYTELQSQLAAANERADGLQDEAAILAETLRHVSNATPAVFECTDEQFEHEFTGWAISRCRMALGKYTAAPVPAQPAKFAAPGPITGVWIDEQPAVVPEGLANPNAVTAERDALAKRADTAEIACAILQRVINEARAQKPVAYRYERHTPVNGHTHSFVNADIFLPEEVPLDSEPLYAAPVPAQPAVVSEVLADTTAALYDMMVAFRDNPACQCLVLERCRCITCATNRARAILSTTDTGTEVKK